MAPRESIREFGVVLRNSPLGESDAVLTLLLQYHGKTPVLVRGIKRSKRRFMGGLDIFDAGLFTFEERETRLPLLTALSERQSFPALSQDLRSFATASLALEVVGHFALERDPEGGAYLETIIKTFSILERKKISPIGEAVRVLISILSQTGFSEFESLTRSHSEVTAWLKNENLAVPDEKFLRMLLDELVCSVEVIVGKSLSTRETLERFFGIPRRK